ncbi:MAG TPA: hypothetical protein VMW56_29420 [Candidatus Margulisiibacteriota bacterium]|nr:hypothetical protein [Candidatus Margulisiibacteriota bacterium]
MSQHSLEARWSCLRRYVGLRINLFRAMHDGCFHLADDRTVIATRSGDYALTACIAYDRVFSYYYVRDCSWYRSDLSRLTDDELPDHIRDDLLRHFLSVLG